MSKIVSYDRRVATFQYSSQQEIQSPVVTAAPPPPHLMEEQTSLSAMRRIRRVASQLFRRGLPPAVVFQKVPLESKSMTDRSPKVNLSYEELRLGVLKAFRIEPTKWHRSYPPLGLDVTLGGAPQNPDKILELHQLSRLLQSYALDHQVTLPIDFQNVDLNDAVERMVEIVFPELRGISLYAKHRYANSFFDEEILQVSSIIHENDRMQFGTAFPRSGHPVFFSFHGISSLGSAVAMLLFELNADEQVCWSFCKGRLEMEGLQRRLKNSNFLLEKTLCPHIDHLEQIIESRPAIVTVDSLNLKIFLEGHYIVLDGIYRQKGVVVGFFIRDPYHQWNAIVKKEGFIRCWVSNAPILQIKNCPPSLDFQKFGPSLNLKS
ncbi:MAG: hypothetical protein KFB95_01945 [Simkaniaceae bacterium]|nr:MAG: hypothetical protein KFB95_01945 [Simkaniaceae bacterium]